MKIKWLGHASFLITSSHGTKIITDPYTIRDDLKYGKINESADIVTVSHDHFDHNNVAMIRGKPEIVRASAKAKGIIFKGIPSYHDDTGGNQRGKNTIFCFEVDGMRLCHLGDLGHRLSEKQISELGKVDILLIPVGGHFTIDAKVATEIGNQLKPRVIIPMHFKTDKCNFPITGVDEFIKGKKGVIQPGSSEVSLAREALPPTTQIMVLKPEM